MDDIFKRLSDLRRSYCYKQFEDIYILDFFTKYRTDIVMVKYKENSRVYEEKYDGGKIQGILES